MFCWKARRLAPEYVFWVALVSELRRHKTKHLIMIVTDYLLCRVCTSVQFAQNNLAKRFWSLFFEQKLL